MRITATAQQEDTDGFTGTFLADVRNPRAREAELRVAQYFRSQGWECIDEASRHLGYDFTLTLPGDMSRGFTCDCKLDRGAAITGNFCWERSIQWPRGKGQHTAGWGMRPEIDYICMATPSPTELADNLPWAGYLLHAGEFRQYMLAYGCPKVKTNPDGSVVYMSIASVANVQQALTFFRRITLPPLSVGSTSTVALMPPTPLVVPAAGQKEVA